MPGAAMYHHAPRPGAPEEFAASRISPHEGWNGSPRPMNERPVSVRTAPENVSYIVLRLADDSFVHVSFHNHGDDEVNPIASTAAFAHFQQDHADRREGGVDQQTAQLVGAYITTID